MDKDLKNKTLPQLEDILETLDQKKFLAKYIFTFIHSKNAAEIDDITPLSKDLRSTLISRGFYISTLKTVEKFTDPDGTIKYLFALPGNHQIETVLLRDGKRTTLCLSTQAGCAMDCQFCATAKIKFKTNLTAAQIADQLNIVQKDIPKTKINNIVYMGMGEPLQNYDQVLTSLRILTHPQGKNIGLRHLTVSTCGLPPAIEKLAEEDIHPRLAISLNAPDDKLRTEIMPINKKYPIKTLLSAVEYYYHKTHQRVTFEYILIKGLNDSDSHANSLIKLLRHTKCNINLIEFNPHPNCPYTASPLKTIERFTEILTESGIETTIRLKKGQKIKAACGQLGAKLIKK